MKKVISLLVVIVMLCAIFAGCNNKGPVDTDDNGKTEVSESTEVQDSAEVSESEAAGEVSTGISSTGNPIGDSYTAFINAKSAVFEKLSDGLSNNPDTVMASMSLLGVAMIDLYMLPVAFFGLGEEATAAGMAMMGAEGVTYTESGNSYTITYKDTEGSTTSLTGVWDAAANSIVCTGTTDGVENFYSEYHTTSYGYVGQYYIANGDGTSALYVVTVSGEDGAFGISTVTAKPAALTGSEPVDYPSSCDEWYAINGSTITGKTSDGTAINFEYTPSPSEG